VLAWRLRARTRAPLAALLFFCGTLFPALGFFNVYPFRYSLVADHFQYLASLGVIVLFSAGVAVLARRWWRTPEKSEVPPSPRLRRGRRSFSGGARRAEAILMIPIALILGILTWREARQYADVAMLYRTILERNPESWLALNNLAILKVHGSAADRAEATSLIKEALRLNPNDAEAHNNLGLALRLDGQPDAALVEQREAVRLKPGLAEAHYNLGLDFQDLDRLGDAEQAYLEALRINPTYIEAHHNLANVLIGLNRFDAALVELRSALAIKSDLPDTRKNLADVLLRLGRDDEAIAEYEIALRDLPGSGELHNNLALALQKRGRLEEAIAHFRTSLQLTRGSVRVRDSLGRALLAAGRPTEALTEFQQALVMDTGQFAAAIHNDLGITLASLGRSAEAAAHFSEALRLRPDFAEARANLAKTLGKGR
jgi:tetratricopeptide (TPR) repeat protein